MFCLIDSLVRLNAWGKMKLFPPLRSLLVGLMLYIPALWSFRIDLDARNRLAEVDPSKIVYQLFTRSNPIDVQIIILNNATSLQASHFNVSSSTKVYVTGWGAAGSASYPARDQYLVKEDCNYITFDWMALIGEGTPEGLINTTQEVGRYLGAFIDFLVDNGAQPNSFHLIGASAGCHAAGAAGAAVTSGRVGRITALDAPDLGIWLYNNTDIRIDASDAVFVDAIHTTGGNGVPEGYVEQIGTADFYVNGGEAQPGCPADPQDDFNACCSHCRAVDLFTESINSYGFTSLSCDSYENYATGNCAGNSITLMGENVQLSARGPFHLRTNDQPPFALGRCIDSFDVIQNA